MNASDRWFEVERFGIKPSCSRELSDKLLASLQPDWCFPHIRQFRPQLCAFPPQGADENPLLFDAKSEFPEWSRLPVARGGIRACAGPVRLCQNLDPEFHAAMEWPRTQISTQNDLHVVKSKAWCTSEGKHFTLSLQGATDPSQLAVTLKERNGTLPIL